MKYSDDQIKNMDWDEAVIALKHTAGTPEFLRIFGGPQGINAFVEAVFEICGDELEEPGFKIIPDGELGNMIDIFILHFTSINPKHQKALRKTIAYMALCRNKSPDDVRRITNMPIDWVYRLISEVHKKGFAALTPDKRTENGKLPLYSKPEIINFIADTIKSDPPDGTRWKGRHIKALMEARFEFQDVPIQRAAENLKRAEKINRKKSD